MRTTIRIQDELYRRAKSRAAAGGRSVGEFIEDAIRDALDSRTTSPADLPDADYPMVLNTGRVLEHWHTGTMTRRASALDALKPGPFVEVHPDDLNQHGFTNGQEITVRSKRGAIRLPVKASTSVQRGSVFIPFHFREAAANVLTNDALDPYGKIPEFKFCAVRLER